MTPRCLPAPSQVRRSALLCALVLIPLAASRAAEPKNPWLAPGARVSRDELANLAVELEGGDVPPMVTRQATPVYPTEMRRSGVQGLVTVRFVVNARGRVEHALAIDSTNSGFERAALDAVEQWVFKPGVKSGRAVNTWTQVDIIFRLGDASDEVPEGLWTIRKPATWDNVPAQFQWDQAPRFVITQYPVFPFELLIAGQKHAVDIGYVVNPAGRISEMYVLGGTPPPEILAATRAVLATWQLEPARKNGQPASAAVRMTLEFNPGGSALFPLMPSMKAILAELKRAQPRITPLEQLDRLPRAISMPAPQIPPWLESQRPQGRAVIEFYIDPEGDARLPRIVSATNPEIGAMAAQAVVRWRFEAPMKDGKAVIARAVVPIDFR